MPNAYGSLLQRSGAVGLNATTSHDAPKYFMSLPANKLELWFALEAERFQVLPLCPDEAVRAVTCVGVMSSIAGTCNVREPMVPQHCMGA